MSNKICAIVITYKREDLLIECIKGIISQTIPIDALILVDNNVISNVIKLLNDKNLLNVNNGNESETYLSDTKIKFHYLKPIKNLGSAGGYFIGLGHGLQYDFNWFWLLDDDVKPLPNALENILQYTNISELINVSKVNQNWERISFSELRLALASSNLVSFCFHFSNNRS